jgi:hypothetical protein
MNFFSLARTHFEQIVNVSFTVVFKLPKAPLGAYCDAKTAGVTDFFKGVAVPDLVGR